jgi:hypothetical protein
MELIPVTAEYDHLSEQMRRFTATRLMETIEAIRPYVAAALSDPDAIHDAEPGRIQAHVALIKLQQSMLRDIGLLYRVQDRPREDKEEVLPVAKVQELLAEAEVRMQEAVAAAALAAAAEAEVRVQQRQQLSLEAARESVVAKLRLLGED